MAHFPLIKDVKANADLKQAYQEMQEYEIMQNNFALNLFTSQGLRPDLLIATWTLMKSIMLEGRLPAALKQMIMQAISTQNKCRYGMFIHSKMLEKLSQLNKIKQQMPVEYTQADMTTLPQEQQNILHFALKVASNPSSAGEADINQLKNQGLATEEIIEIIMTANLTNFLNTWADVSGINLDNDDNE